MEHLPSFNAVDIVALIYLVIGVLVGVHRGLSEELARFISMVIAFGIALFAYRPVALWMIQHTRLEAPQARALAFLATVVGALIVMLLLRLALKRFMQFAFEEGTEKVGGGIAGFAGSAIAVVIVFLAVNLWPHEYLNRHFGKESLIGRLVVRYVPALREKVDDLELPEKVREGIHDTESDIGRQLKEGWNPHKREAPAKPEDGKKAQDRIRGWFSHRPSPIPPSAGRPDRLLPQASPAVWPT